MADSLDLRSRLETVLPKGHQFGIYHLSTPPTKSSALYSAPPNERPDRTFCENHFLAVTINVPAPQSTENGENSETTKAIVLAIEIMIYTTAHTSTLFVSKADSTGYLSLLNLPKGTPSPIREVCSTFVSYLVDCRRRKDLPFVVSLFARSQSQYLFPGSVENANKHVLDDRGLIKWWCRVLDPMLESKSWNDIQGYLVIPGLEQYESRSFIPRTSLPKWSLTHPLERISHYTKEFDWVPPRCLIPKYPDDPKSRFRDELDEEAAGSGAMKQTGSWKSVKTLDMFWEMMAFRQECSSGRMTGFIWVVFDNTAPERPSTPTKQQSNGVAPQTTPRKLHPPKNDTRTITDAQRKLQEKKKKEQEKEKRRKRHAPGTKITIRGPRSKTEQKNHLLKLPESTPYYHWPTNGRGEKLVSEKIYKRILELLLHLDFATLEKATSSTKRWINEASMGSTWGVEINGQREATVVSDTKEAPAVNNLSGLVKRKRESDGDGVKTLDAGLIKKVKVDEGPTFLGASLVRKKPKD